MLSVSLPHGHEPEYCVIAQHADALGRRRRWMAFGLAAGVSVAVALAFAAAGAWPVLPWSALEIGVLAVAFAIVERRAKDWERLTVSGDRVIVERSVRGRSERHEFNRWWLRVEVNGGERPGEPQLSLRFRGEAMEFGNALPPARRIEVARALKRLTASR